MTPTPDDTLWADVLVHPIPMAAALTLAVNDHLLKGAGLLPGWFTGKLSDVAGLFFFPLLLVALARGVAIVAGWRVRRDGVVAIALTVLTAALFAAANLNESFNALLAQTWGVLTMDPTDLLTLPALAASVLWLRHTQRRAEAEQ